MRQGHACHTRPSSRASGRRAAVVSAIIRSWLAGYPCAFPIGIRAPLLRLGAIMRAGRELGLPVKDAAKALEWQTVRPVADWNDDPRRTHADVITTFDHAIAALYRSTADD
jgi:hypothetical protein